MMKKITLMFSLVLICFCWKTNAQTPPNDNLADAIPLIMGASCTNDFFTNEGATAQTDEPMGSCFTGATHTVWFSFTAPTSGAVEVSTDVLPGDLGDSQIAVYPAPSDPSDLSTLPPEVGCDQDGGKIVVFNGTSNYMSILEVGGLVGGDTYYVQVDGWNGATGDFCIQVTEITCPSPRNLTASSINRTSAVLDWSEIGSATMWDIEFGPSGFAPTGTPTYNDVTKPYPVAGLTKSTTYQFYVRADCGGGDESNWVGPFGFSTGPVFQENFDDEGDIPSDWTTASGSFAWSLNSGSTSSTGTGPDAANSVPNYVYTESSSGSLGDIAELISPVIDLSGLPPVVLEFYYHMTGADMGNLHIDIHNGSSWDNDVFVISGEQQTSESDPWLPQIVDLSAYSGAIQVRFRAERGDGFTSDMAVDDVSVYKLPTCTVPNTLTAVNAVGNSIDLGWTEVGTATTWDVYVVPAGDPAPTIVTTPSFPGVTTNPFTATGLNPATNYDFYVRADCGGGDLSAWSESFAFISACGTTVAPWADNLEAHAPVEDFIDSNCWTTTSVSSYNWNVGNDDTPTSSTGPSAAFSGMNFFYTEGSDGAAGDVAELISPMMDVSALTAPALEFYYHMYGSDMGELHVDVYDGTAWVNDVFTIVGEQQTDDTDPWLSKLVDLSAYSGTIQVRFRAISAGTIYGDISLDDISLIDGPSCYMPTDLSVANIKDTSADLGWTSAATAWDIHIVPAGDPAPTSATTPSNPGVSSSPYNATGLTALTDYEFYVRTDCGGGDLSEWAGPFAFTTACAPEVAPWTDDVEAHTPVTDFVSSNCWTTTSVSSYNWNIDDDDTPSGSTGPSGAFSGINFFYTEGSDGAAGDVAELYSPLVDISALTAPALKFYYHMYGGDMGELHVDIYDGTAWVNDVLTIVGEQQTDDTDPWLSKFVDLSAYSGTIQVRFRAISAGTFNGDISLDDISFMEMPSCFAPSALTAANITDTSADLSWTESNTPPATTWDIEIVDAGATPTGTPTATGVTNPYNKTGLIPATSYEFYVRTDCGGGDTSVWAGPFAFTTTCPTTAFIPDYLQDFSSGVAPDCWEEAGSGDPATGPSGSSGSWIQDDFLNNGTNQAARINLYASSKEEWLISPSFDLSAGNYSLVYTAAVTDYNNSSVPGGAGMGSDDEVQVLISTDNGVTWTNLKTYNQAGYPSNTGDVERIDLSAYTGVAKFAFWATEGSVNDTEDYDFFIDDFKVETTPTCLAPSALTVASASITGTGADLGWTDNNTPAATTWDVHIVPTGDPAPTGSTTPSDPGVTANPYAVSTLSSSSTYDFYVRADCGGGDFSTWAGPFTFSTTCGAVTATYSENFDGITEPAVPSCWTVNPSSSAGSDILTVTSTDDSRQIPSSPNAIEINSIDNVILASPSFSDLPTGQNQVRVKISYEGAPATNWTDELVVGVMTDPSDNSTFVALHTLTAPTVVGFTQYTFSLSNTALIGTSTHVAFKYSSGSGAYEFYLDDFVYEPLPTCLLPSSLTATGMSTNSANLGWTENNTPAVTTWDVHVVPAGDPAPTSTTTPTDPGVTANPYLVSTLNPSTNYDFYVRADCGGGDLSAWAGPFTFSTLCQTASLPYTQDFSNGFPNCWTRSSTTDVIVEATCGSRSDVLRFDYEEQAITGPIDASGAFGLKVSYYIADSVCGNVADAGEIFNVDYWDGTQWITAKSYDAARPDEYTHEYFFVPQSDLSSEFKVRFDQQPVASTDSWFIDDLVVELPSCVPPSGITVSNIEDTSADISWTPEGSETEWKIEYGPTGFVLGNGTVVMDTDGTPGITISDFAPETTYDVYVGAVCTELTSMGGPETFTTGVLDCPDVTNISIVNVTQTSFEVTWTAGGAETIWKIEYGPEGFTPGTGIVVIDGDGIGEVIIGLDPETEYDVYVTAICNGYDGTNVGPITFDNFLGIENQVFEDFTFYPNPVNNRLSLKANSQIQKVVIYNLLGQEVMRLSPDSLSPTLNLSNLQTGTYLMQVTIEGTKGVYKILKE